MTVLSDITVLSGPVHEHDSDCDVYLGTREVTSSSPDVDGVIHSERRTYDLYWCQGQNLLARYGKDGDYASGMSFVFSSPIIHLAYELAMADNSPLSASQRWDLRTYYGFRLMEELEKRTSSARRLGIPVLEQLIKDIDVLLEDTRR